MPYITDAELSRLVITQAKKTPERAWLRGVSTAMLHQTLAELNIAYRAFFVSLAGHRRGPRISEPKYRSRKDTRQSVRFARNARFGITVAGKLRLPKIGEVVVRWSRDLPADPSSVTVVKDSAGRYFASFVVECAIDPLASTSAETGIDLGLTHFAVLSDGTKIDNPRFLRRAERKLKRAQRALSRKESGSRNMAKSRSRLAKQHARVADARREFLHQLSTQIIRDNQAVYVEDLAVNGLGRTRLAKSVHDAGWSAFVAMLEYKAKKARHHFARIGRFEPTSQVCSSCGILDGPKSLHVREWTCRMCGVGHDRDHNAAKNILAAGQADSLNACGDQVRPASGPAPVYEPGSQRGAA